MLMHQSGKRHESMLDYRSLLMGCLLSGTASSVGCTSQERYLIAHTELAAAKNASADTAPVAVSATRERDRQPVYVKLSALQKETLVPHGDGTFVIVARAKNPMITAGSVLTWIGTAISLLGTSLVAVGKVQENTTLFYLGGISALSAEPLMWTGTGLWIAGAMRRPYEVTVPAGVPRQTPF